MVLLQREQFVRDWKQLQRALTTAVLVFAVLPVDFLPAPRLDDFAVTAADGAPVLEAAARSLPRHRLRALDQRLLQRSMSENLSAQLRRVDAQKCRALHF